MARAPRANFTNLSQGCSLAVPISPRFSSRPRLSVRAQETLPRRGAGLGASSPQLLTAAGRVPAEPQSLIVLDHLEA